MKPHHTTAEDIAKKAVTTMLATDNASAALGMSLESVQPGQSHVSMDIRPDMVNGHNITHGGVIFTLADTAFACAGNSHNIVNVAANCQINFLRPALLGDTLHAHAVEQSLGRRSGVYDVRIENQNGKLVALFRGHSMSLDKPVFRED